MYGAAYAYGALLAYLLVGSVLFVVLVALVAGALANYYLAALAPLATYTLYGAALAWAAAIGLGAFKQRMWGLLAAVTSLGLTVAGFRAFGFTFSEPRPVGDYWSLAMMAVMLTTLVFAIVCGHKVIEANVDHTYAD